MPAHDRLSRARAARRHVPATCSAEGLERRTLLAATVVADAYTAPASSDPQQVFDVGGTALFSAEAQGTGAELWKSDGTAAGTALVKDVMPGPSGSAPASFVDLGGTVLFTAYLGGIRVRQLWRTDGTAAGTVRVTDAVDVDAEATIQPGQRDLFRHGDAVYFRGIGADGSGAELWRTDGTAAGTYRVKDIRPGPAGSSPASFVSTAGKLFFTANDGVHGGEWWVTDGTEAGTRLVKDVVPGEQSLGLYRDSAGAGGRVFFATTDTYPSAGVWASDGTDQGTVRLLTSPGRGVSFAALGDRMLIFTEGRGHQGVYSSDGTVAGTVELKGFDENFAALAQPTAGGGVVYFVRFDYDGAFNELWKTDGTAAGTVLLESFPLSAGNYGGALLKLVIGRRLFFTSAAGSNAGARDVELWFTDGTPGGAARVKDIAPGPDASDPQEFADVGGVAFFSADDGRTGRELWRSDGTEAGTYLVKDITPSTLDSNPHHLVDANGTLYAATDRNDWQTQFVRTDATGNGVVPAGAHINPYSEWVESVTASGSLVYSITYYWPATGGWRLYRTDGTSDGTVQLGAFEPAEAMVDLDDKGTVLFSGNHQLWRSDGTRQGTVMVKEFAGGAVPFANLNGVVLLSAHDGPHGPELWRSDGTEAGTVLVKDIVPGPGGSDPKPVAVVGGVAYFRVYRAPGVVELWKSDGTEAGTVRVAAVGDGPYPIGYPLRPEAPIGAALGGTLIFSAYNAERKLELWRSDGTEAGTYRIDPAPGTLSPTSFASYGGKVYFAGTDAEAGRELWSTDGTVTGTRRAADLWPGAVGSAPDWLTVSDGTLWFAADSPQYGRELWKYTPDEPAVVARHVFYNSSKYDGNDPAANTLDDGAIPPEKVALLPGQTGSFANVISDPAGITGVMIDVDPLPAGVTLTPDDFATRVGLAGVDPSAWAAGAAPSVVAVRRGAGTGGSDRVTLIWPDNSIRNTWLQVTMKSGERTGLARPDVFYLASLVGERGSPSDLLDTYRVDAGDLAGVKAALNTNASIINTVDFNRDGRVNALDLGAAKSNLNHSLARLAAPPDAAPLAPLVTTPAPSGAAGAQTPQDRFLSTDALGAGDDDLLG